MPSKTKVKDFFGENRREFRLNSYNTLMTSAEEKRLKLAVEMPLSNQPLVAIPTWVANPFTEMEKDDSLTTRCNIDVMLEGMTVDVFPTDKAKRRQLTTTGVMLQGFHLVTTGEEEKKETMLNLTIYMPGSIELRDWCWEMLHKTFWAAFEYSQSELDFSDTEEEDGESATVPAAEKILGSAKKGFDAAAIARAAGSRTPN